MVAWPTGGIIREFERRALARSTNRRTKAQGGRQEERSLLVAAVLDAAYRESAGFADPTTLSSTATWLHPCGHDRWVMVVEYVIRFCIGGFAVSAFAVLGDLFRQDLSSSGLVVARAPHPPATSAQ